MFAICKTLRAMCFGGRAWFQPSASVQSLRVRVKYEWARKASTAAAAATIYGCSLQPSAWLEKSNVCVLM